MVTILICPYRYPALGLLVGEIILARTFSAHICRTAMQTAAKGIGITQINLNHIHPQFVHLLSLIDFGLFNTNGFRV